MTYNPVRPPKSAEAVLEALQHLSHASAPDVLEWINRKNADKVKSHSLTSIYRSLNYLASVSKIKPLNFNDGQVRYEVNSHNDHHHHLVCTKCNRIQSVDVCPINDYLKTLKSKFMVEYHNFDVFGICHSCITPS
ncbi:MAG: transcriptional repressor [Cyanobacteria bacterium P01_H01_bin.74]